MKLCGKEVPPLGLGTWKMGGGYFSPSYERDQEDVEAIRYALSRGIRIIDTAEMYGGGHAEELVGRAIKGFDREEIVIITKVWPNHLRYNDVINSAKASLRRLQVEYIDLYLIHWPSSEVPLSETLSAMEKLKEENLVRCVGVSNFDLPLLKEAQKYAKIEADEVEYNLYNLSPERELIPYCQSQGVHVIAYSPLAQGKVIKDKRVVELAKKYGKPPSAIALNYLMKRSIPIPKASNKAHLDEALEALSFSLSKEDEEYLRGRF
ncbi:MAG: aldo/keto reductase [Candidatus Aramenus sulfurataquae]|jgi:diketogulonate reductase-like aldo/keto reductase|uniref:Aldo/keto reductase n=3 Tax=Candidatus Aramenus sulfurataquae TaxID=1326980 RepID=W7KHJ6_9CREN|nr:MAG: aldo/keto reductase [Candidatus Aramenus sulfurataquae]MCL7344460.1 aldo/keto reductase [Candidatus Aramenus sulfurataquae]